MRDRPSREGKRDGTREGVSVGTHDYCPSCARRVSLLYLSSLSASALSNPSVDILSRCSHGASGSCLRPPSPYRGIEPPLHLLLPSPLLLLSRLFRAPRSSFARRKSLSFHYYCPILPLTSFFMPLRRSLRCHSNLRWLTMAGIKALPESSPRPF